MNSNKPSEYEDIPLHRKDLLPNPISQFSLWFAEAKSRGESDPTIMTLATVDKNYSVTARMVLLKEVDPEGFVFFTNYDSPKSQALNEIPNAALVFWWPSCQRQIRVTGKVSKLPSQRSDEYFASRPFGSKVAAIVSKQSAVITDRDALLAQYLSASDKLNKDSVPRPANWGGYVLKPDTLECWQGRPNRLHDRFEYRKQGENWVIVQLSP